MKPFTIAPRRAPHPRPAASPADKVNVLVVDDQASNIIALESLLDDADFSVVRATSGPEALRALLEQDFAVLLLDVLMPGMDGFETAELVRRRPQSRHTPVIFLTAASANDAHIQRGYALGAVDYIYKPIVPEILKAKLGVFVELHRKSRALARSEAALRAQLAELRRLEAARKESDSRYRQVFSRASDAIMLFDAAGRKMVDANHAALALYGYPRVELLRLGRRDLEAGRALPGAPYREHRAKDGRVFPAEVTSALITVGGTKYTMVLTRDLSERLRAEEAGRLREREAVQRHLVSTVSHELRTPIAAIRASVETLSRPGCLDARDRPRFMKIIERQTERLSGLVEDILTVAELEAGRHKARPEKFGLKDFAERFEREFFPLAARRGVALEVEVRADVQLWVDTAHFERIFQNVVDNAIKYNRRGGRVRVECGPGEDGFGKVSIHDTGIGIPSGELLLIFHQFYRTSAAKSHAARGSGLGLFIIKSLLDLNGGRIWAESKPGEGSTFHFTVPVARESGV